MFDGYYASQQKEETQEEIERERKEKINSIITDLYYRFDSMEIDMGVGHSKFKPRDLVTWKNKLKNRNFPKYGEPAIVIKFGFDTYDPNNSSLGRCFREPLDLNIGVIDDNDEFVFIYVDSHRLVKFQN